jgi:plasmid replication initiation protein
MAFSCSGSRAIAMSRFSSSFLTLQITGGRERWLYRVAREHAGGNGADGFAISMPVLFEKSSAEGTYRRFKFEILRIVERNDLPGFSLSIIFEAGKEPLIHMLRREHAGEGLRPFHICTVNLSVLIPPLSQRISLRYSRI